MRAPKNPTVVTKNPQHNKYIIQFAPELTDFILKEGKVKTYRFGNKYDYLKMGDQIILQEYGSKKFIAKAEIIQKEKTTFGQLPLNIEGREISDSKQHQRKVFSSYFAYIGRGIEDNDPFWILGFKLTDASRKILH